MAIGLTVILTSLMLGVAVGILKMNAPHLGSLWLLSWFAATVIAIGTLVLFAALGTVGQLVALLVFVYLALASSGGTVPLDALSGFFRFLANFEPLAHGNRSASAVRTSAPTRRSAHDRANPSDGSAAATRGAPTRSTSSAVSAPGPQPTSSTRWPGCTPAKSANSGASGASGRDYRPM